MRFFKSRNVKIFPCSNRGHYKHTSYLSDHSSSIDEVFDPESRLASEYNFSHLTGLAGSKDSYVISYKEIPGSKLEGDIYNDYLLKVVLGGYYFEIVTKPVYYNNAWPEGAHSPYELSQSTLWLTLTKTILRTARTETGKYTKDDVEEQYTIDTDSMRVTYSLGSMLYRVYSSSIDTEGLSLHINANTNTTPLLILNEDIRLNKLDICTIEKDTSTPSDYFCTALGITSSESASSFKEFNIDSDANENNASDVIVIKLDLSDPTNWLENQASSSFLYQPGTTNIECTADVIKLKDVDIQGKLNVSDSTHFSSDVYLEQNAQLHAPDFIGEQMVADSLVAHISLESPQLTVSKLVLPSSTDPQQTHLELAPVLTSEMVASERIILPDADKLVFTTITQDQDGQPIVGTKCSSLTDKLTETKDDLRDELYGDTRCQPKTSEELGEDVTWDPNNAAHWSSDIPDELTLTTLQKSININKQKIQALVTVGGEQNKLEALKIGENSLTISEKVIDLDQQLALANISDGNRVQHIEDALKLEALYDEADPSKITGYTFTLAKDVDQLKEDIKGLDNIMNFRGIITPIELGTLTQGTSPQPNYNKLLGKVEVGDVVIIQAEGDTFDYTGIKADFTDDKSKTYHNYTEFVCTAIKYDENKDEPKILKTQWQEIGTCNITDSLLKEIIGEDTDNTRTGSIKARLCAAEDSISNIQDENTTGTVSNRIKTIEGVLSDYTGEKSIQVRLTDLETLTSADGDIRSTIATNTEAIGDSETPDTIIYRLNDIEAILSPDIGDNTGGETTGSLPDRVTALEGEVSDIKDVIGTTANESGTLTGRLNALETNSIVAAAKDLTLDQLTTNIKNDVIGDSNFTKMVDESISGSVETHTPGKVADFISNDYDYANDSKFTDAVGGILETYAEGTDFTGAVEAEIVKELQKVNVADIEFSETPEGPKIKIEDKVNEAFLSEVAEVNLDTLTFKPSPEGEAITIATAVSNAFDSRIKAVNLDTLTFEPNPGEDAVTIATAVSNAVNEVISDDIDKVDATRVLSNDEDDTVEARIIPKINRVIGEDIDTVGANRVLNDDKTVGDKITAGINELIGADIDTIDTTRALSNTENDTVEARITDKVSGLINDLFQQAWVPYAVAFDVNGADSSTPMPMAAIKDCEITLPDNLTRTGYKFNGWSTTESGDNKVQSPYKVSANQILHAIWEETLETEG